MVEFGGAAVVLSTAHSVTPGEAHGGVSGLYTVPPGHVLGSGLP